MPSVSRLLIAICLFTVTLPAGADDNLPAPPNADASSPQAVSHPFGSSADSGGFVAEEPAPKPAVHVHGSPATGDPNAGADLNPVEARVPPYSARVRQSSLDQFQSSRYWAPPQPFDPGAAPNYSHTLAWGAGMHIRYPYFKYRSPWVYQGPAGVSHTIEWSTRLDIASP